MQTSGVAPPAPAAAAPSPAAKPPASAPSPAVASPAAAEPAAPPSQPSATEAPEQEPSLIPIPPRPSKYRHEWLQMQVGVLMRCARAVHAHTAETTTIC